MVSNDNPSLALRTPVGREPPSTRPSPGSTLGPILLDASEPPAFRERSGPPGEVGRVSSPSRRPLWERPWPRPRARRTRTNSGALRGCLRPVRVEPRRRR